MGGSASIWSRSGDELAWNHVLRSYCTDGDICLPQGLWRFMELKWHSFTFIIAIGGQFVMPDI